MREAWGNGRLCVTAVILMLTRSWTGDFHNIQGAAEMSICLLGMRGVRKSEAATSSKWSGPLSMFMLCSTAVIPQLGTSTSCMKQQGCPQVYWAWEKPEGKRGFDQQ
jgi:hypothetical protein